MQPAVFHETAGVAPGGGCPKGCPRHRFLSVPENPLQAVCAGGTRCPGWCAWGGHILQERKQFHFKPRGPAQPKGPLCEACGDTTTPVTRMPVPPPPWHQHEFPLSAHGRLCRGGLRLLRPSSQGRLERESRRHLPLVLPAPWTDPTARLRGPSKAPPGESGEGHRVPAMWSWMGGPRHRRQRPHPHHPGREGLGLPDGCGPLQRAVLSMRALQP